MIDAGTGGTIGTGGAAGTGGTTGTGGATSGTGGVGGTTIDAGTGGATAGTGGATGGAGGDSGTGGVTGGTGGVTGGAGGTMDAAPEAPPPPGAVFAVGSFSKSGSTGSQSIAHGLGQVPKALILWTIGKTNESQSSGFYYGIGMSDASASYAIASTARDGVSPAWAIRRITSKALLMISSNGTNATVAAEASLPGWSSTNFTLDWTTNDGQPSVVHYVVIGGPQVTAKVVHWLAPTAPGTQTVSGIGFQPETVLHFYPGWGYDEAPDSNVTNAVIGLGAMDKTGAQWAVQAGSVHNVSPTTASRAQRTDSAIYSYTDTGPAVNKDAKFVSMNADGFTVNFTTANSAASHLYSLALGGLKASVGSFNKTTGTAPATQSVTSGFQPGALLLASFQTTAQTSGTAVSTGSIGLGASDGTHEASSAVVADNGVSTASVEGIDKASKVFIKMNTAPLDAEADLASFGASGFNLNWTTNDATASQICFVALGAK
jgi:hypothetical protein